MNRQMAHYHPNLDEPCAHDAPRWQKSLPLAELPNGWYVNADQLPKWLLLAADALVIAGIVALVWVVMAVLS